MEGKKINIGLGDILGMIDNRILQEKINIAIDNLKKGDVEELTKKFNSLDKNELLNKINQLDSATLQKLNVDEMLKRIDNNDIEKLSRVSGKSREEILALMGRLTNLK